MRHESAADEVLTDYFSGKTDRRASSQTVRMRARARNERREGWQGILANGQENEKCEMDQNVTYY